MLVGYVWTVINNVYHVNLFIRVLKEHILISEATAFRFDVRSKEYFRDERLEVIDHIFFAKLYAFLLELLIVFQALSFSTTFYSLDRD